jgi:hypothetical protein
MITSAYAERVPERYIQKNTQELKQSAALCSPGAGFEIMSVNNVRARINTGGDMWQNFATAIAQYYIPANTNKTSLYAGALWIAGVDKYGQLKLAAQRFRQEGVDFFPGPITIDKTASTDNITCAKWDKMFHVTKAEVMEYRSYVNSENPAEEFPGYTTPASIREWPAHPDDPNMAYYLAPFYDADGDGEYNASGSDGKDYPYYDFENDLCPLNYVDVKGWKPAPTMGSADSLASEGGSAVNSHKTEIGGILSDQVIKGDETYWWVFNDKGNAHSESKGQPIGLEIRAQAFAFATNDEVNNMTFYSYEIINRSTFTLTNTYFSPWTDADLGYAKDDYVGCDVERGMGYCYNGKDIDGSGQVEAYGEHPPAIGVDFFQGPYLDPDNSDNPAYKTAPKKGPSFQGNCEIVSYNGQEITMSYGWNVATNAYDSVNDKKFIVRAEAINGVNFGNGIVDDERFGMRRFVYYNNTTDPVNGEPSRNNPSDYYNYLRGIWKNGQRMHYDGKAATSNTGPETDFMFPGLSDPCNWGTNGETNYPFKDWTDKSAENTPDDRRFMQSAGPFTLLPGAVNYITFGVPWARDMSGDALASVAKLQQADDKCQALFDNCFKVLDGPEAPDMYFVELDKQIIIHLRNDAPSSNNKDEGYKEKDQTIIKGDSLYRFEGYQIFQLANANVGPEDLMDLSKARQIVQFDIENGVGRLVNFEADAVSGYDMPVLRVEGADKGISHTFEVTTDAFATGDRALVNNKQYYFMAIAYAYNNYQKFDPYNSAEGGQRFPYLSGRHAAGGVNLQAKVAIPHKTIKGQVTRSKYGDIPPITRIEGKGNGGAWLELSNETRKEILSKKPLPFDTVLEKHTVLFGDTEYPIAYKATYKANAGPVLVKVIDPLRVEAKDYILRFKPATCKEAYNPMTRKGSDNTFAYYISEAEWELLEIQKTKQGIDTILCPSDNISVSIKKSSDTLAQQILTNKYEQLFPNLGISITINQTFQPGDYWLRNSGNGYLGYEAIFADSSKIWLGGIPDEDIPTSPLNWIRSGSYYTTLNEDGGYDLFQDHNAHDKSERQLAAWDPQQNYEKIFGGTWSPYLLASARGMNAYRENGALDDPFDYESLYGPVCGGAVNFTYDNFMTSIGSVDVVLTPDKSLWTRSMVIEMGNYSLRNEGQGHTFCLRKAPSLDKNGKSANPNAGASNNPDDANYISATGMSWFPGYAINIDTGERLNIIFGENSSFTANNGRDMRFNPTNLIFDANGNYYMGGQHYVYIMGHKMIYHTSKGSDDPQNAVEMPAYDACAKYLSLYKKPKTLPQAGGDPTKDYVLGKNAHYYIMSSCMYVGMPVPALGYENMFDYWMTGDEKYKIDTTNTAFTLKIRVGKPYARYASENLANPQALVGGKKGGEPIPVDPQYNPLNHDWPMYSFSTKGMEAYIDQAKIISDVDLISVTPNPYYAYAGYERNALDNRVRFANLPESYTISIYNIGGILIRQWAHMDNSANSDYSNGQSTHLGNTLDWDLKNFAGVPISGGTYLIHIKTPHGDKVIKWFGVIRTVDLTTY